MLEVLDGSRPEVVAAAERIARGEVVSQHEADLVLNALAAEMLEPDNFDGEELAGRGLEIDDFIGIVAQASENFFD